MRPSCFPRTPRATKAVRRSQLRHRRRRQRDLALRVGAAPKPGRAPRTVPHHSRSADGLPPRGAHRDPRRAGHAYAEQWCSPTACSCSAATRPTSAKSRHRTSPTFIEAASRRLGVPAARHGERRGAERDHHHRGLHHSRVRRHLAAGARSAGAAASRDLREQPPAGPWCRNDHVVGGATATPSAASSGLAGANGRGARRPQREGMQPPDCSGETQVGGQPGNNNTRPATTRAATWAQVRSPARPQAPPAAASTAPAARTPYQHSDPSQAALCKYDCTVPGTGLQGGVRRRTAAMAAAGRASAAPRRAA